jgi:hypothetical protein
MSGIKFSCVVLQKKKKQTYKAEHFHLIDHFTSKHQNEQPYVEELLVNYFRVNSLQIAVTKIVALSFSLEAHTAS